MFLQSITEWYAPRTTCDLGFAYVLKKARAQKARAQKASVFRDALDMLGSCAVQMYHMCKRDKNKKVITCQWQVVEKIPFYDLTLSLSLSLSIWSNNRIYDLSLSRYGPTSACGTSMVAFLRRPSPVTCSWTDFH